MLKNAVTQCLSNVHLKTGRDVAREMDTDNMYQSVEENEGYA